jgi:NTP pyrophosphatase (non-canonical NTP hydrolase)
MEKCRINVSFTAVEVSPSAGPLAGIAKLRTLIEAIEAVSIRYEERFGVRRDVEWCLLKLTEELGELTQAHLKLAGQSRGGDDADWRKRFEDEMADVLGQLLVLASLTKVDLDAALDRKWLRWHPSRMSKEEYFS